MEAPTSLQCALRPLPSASVFLPAFSVVARRAVPVRRDQPVSLGAIHPPAPAGQPAAARHPVGSRLPAEAPARQDPTQPAARPWPPLVIVPRQAPRRVQLCLPRQATARPVAANPAAAVPQPGVLQTPAVLPETVVPQA